ncbi:MAG: hypothetical protein ACRC77_10475 [Bacteroidales bacterium]
MATDNKTYSLRLNQEQQHKLESIRSAYGFRSSYQICNAVMAAFLNNIDLDGDVESCDDEIREIFAEFADHESVEYIKPRKALSHV